MSMIRDALGSGPNHGLLRALRNRINNQQGRAPMRAPTTTVQEHGIVDNDFAKVGLAPTDARAAQLWNNGGKPVGKPLSGRWYDYTAELQPPEALPEAPTGQGWWDRDFENSNATPDFETGNAGSYATSANNTSLDDMSLYNSQTTRGIHSILGNLVGQQNGGQQNGDPRRMALMTALSSMVSDKTGGQRR